MSAYGQLVSPWMGEYELQQGGCFRLKLEKLKCLLSANSGHLGCCLAM